MMKDKNTTTLTKALNVVASIIFGISLVVCSVIGGFATFATDADYYREVQSGLGVTPSRIGLSSEENMMIANESLADYMAGRIDDMQVIVTNYGAEQPLWSSQAISHMKDVRDLVQLWSTIAIVLGVYMVGYIVYRVRDKSGRLKLCSDVVSTYCIVGIVIGIIAVSVLVFGFNDVFVIFHKLFFSNNDWLFAPSDLIVRLLPEKFFLTMAVRGGITVLSVVAITLISAIIYRKVANRQIDKKD